MLINVMLVKKHVLQLVEICFFNRSQLRSVVKNLGFSEIKKQNLVFYEIL